MIDRGRIIRFATRSARPPVGITREIQLPRPGGSAYSRPVRAMLYFAGTEAELRRCSELILDLPGGGFVRRTNADAADASDLHGAGAPRRTIAALGHPHSSTRALAYVQSSHGCADPRQVGYSKAPEHPFPYALHEVRCLVRPR